MNLKNKNLVLGELETEVMEVMWKLDAASVREVLAVLEKTKKVAYTTVMTVMARLYEKGILRRRLDDGGAYIYEPVQDREAFLAASSKKLIKNILSEFGEIAVAQFLDAVGSSNIKDLEKWQRKLKNIK